MPAVLILNFFRST